MARRNVTDRMVVLLLTVSCHRETAVSNAVYLLGQGGAEEGDEPAAKKVFHSRSIVVNEGAGPHTVQ